MRKKRKLQFGEIYDEVNFTQKENFRVNIYIIICDILISDISKRSSIYDSLIEDFQLFFYLF